jgi:acetolactate synthase-1/3 small subunit
MQTTKKTFGGQCGECSSCGKCQRVLKQNQPSKKMIKEQSPTMEQDSTKLYTFLVYSENVPGLLSQITAVFTRRQVNIESLNVCASSTPGAHKYTVTAYCDERMARILTAQIEKRIEVLQAHFYTDDELFINETALFKLSTPVMLKNHEVSSLVRSHDARIIEVNSTYAVVEITGNTNDIIDLFNELKKLDCVLQFVRSGRICITKSRTEHLDEYLAVREAKRIAQQKK